MAQGWSSPSSSTKSERSAIRADFPAQERDTSAWVPCQIHSPAWSGLAGLEQQHHPEHTEELSVRYASTPASSLSFLFLCLCHVVLAHCQPDTPSHSGPSYNKDRLMYMLGWLLNVSRVFVDGGESFRFRTHHVSLSFFAYMCDSVFSFLNIFYVFCMMVYSFTLPSHSYTHLQQCATTYQLLQLTTYLWPSLNIHELHFNLNTIIHLADFDPLCINGRNFYCRVGGFLLLPVCFICPLLSYNGRECSVDAFYYPSVPVPQQMTLVCQLPAPTVLKWSRFYEMLLFTSDLLCLSHQSNCYTTLQSKDCMMSMVIMSDIKTSNNAVF